MGEGRKGQASSSKFAHTGTAGLDKHALYQQAVQYPPGDIHWMCKFYRQYVGTKAPCHLREDFCGTALISSTWCRQDVCRTATGIDLDGEVLQWGLQHNTDGCQQRLCLVQGNVLQPPSNGRILRQQEAASSTAQQSPQQQQQQQQSCCSPVAAATATSSSNDSSTNSSSLPQLAENSVAAAAAEGQGSDALTDADADSAADGAPETPEQLAVKPADIICAFNFSVCLLHSRPQLLAYFRNVAASLCTDPGGVFVLDLMGGHSAEQVADFKRTNFKSGLRYTFEQERFNPLTKAIRCHITLQDPSSKRLLRRAFTYNWRLWSVSDVVELLREAGFQNVAVWAKQLQGSAGSGSSSDLEEDGHDVHNSSSSSSEAKDSSNEGSDEGSEGGDDEAHYVEFTPAAASSAYLNRLAKGWTSYIVAVMLSS